MNNLSCMWSRCGLFWMIGVLFSISMLVTAHGTSWAATTPKIAGGGQSYAIALKSDGTVWAWGENSDGHLGDGSNISKYTPVQLNGLSDATAIACGYHHTLALKSDGTVWAWGRNDYGQLGDGTYTNKTTPVQLSSLSGVTAIACGYYHTLALKSDGTVWAWGRNDYGQLGDGTYTERNTPVQITSLSGVTAIAVGNNFTLALKSDGTVWAWGWNSGGQLGDGTQMDRTTPVQVSGLNLYTSSATTPTLTPTPIPSDTTAPSGSISINSGASYTNSATVTLTLTATDSVGVTGYYLSDSFSTPSASASGWTSVTSTTSYSGTVSYFLSGGEGGKTMYVWYKDAAGYVSNSASDTIALDTTAPTVNITSPTTDTTYTTTSSTISLGGSASDSVSGISSVTWINNKGESGTASGWYSWSVSSISLSSGDNTITVTARDGAGNTGMDTITVTYSGNSAPTVTTGSALSVTSTSVILTGTVSINGLSTTVWFEYGMTSGSYSNTRSAGQIDSASDGTRISATISGLLSGTTYYYRIVAQNSAGTSYGSESSFTTSVAATPTPTPTPSSSDTTAPSCSLSINSGDSYTNSTTVTLTLSATDNIGVTGYYVSDSSSTPPATASGWSSVTVTLIYSGTVSYSLSGGEGAKTVYVWFKDAVGNVSNSASATITLDTTVPTVNITSPTTDNIYTTTSGTISLGGSASDSTSGVSTVSWSNSSSGTSGTVNGTTTWITSSITLSNGNNVITVTATDGAGNNGTDTITVKYTSETTTPNPSPTPTLPPLPSPSPAVSPSPANEGVVFGFVCDMNDNPLKGVTVTITGNNVSNSTTTNNDGYYEFDELAAGDYTLTCEKDGYETQTLSISLEEDKVFVVDDVTMEESETGKIYGYVVKINGNPIESARLKLKGITTKVVKNTSSDADGFFEFTGLGADTYVIFAKKTRYKKAKATVKLEEEESKEIEIEMKRTSKRIKGLILMDDGQ